MLKKLIDEACEKTVEAKYKNGQKSGKCLFWSQNKIPEINYCRNRIIAVID